MSVSRLLGLCRLFLSTWPFFFHNHTQHLHLPLDHVCHRLFSLRYRGDEFNMLAYLDLVEKRFFFSAFIWSSVSWTVRADITILCNQTFQGCKLESFCTEALELLLLCLLWALGFLLLILYPWYSLFRWLIQSWGSEGFLGLWKRLSMCNKIWAGTEDHVNLNFLKDAPPQPAGHTWEGWEVVWPASEQSRYDTQSSAFGDAMSVKTYGVCLTPVFDYQWYSMHIKHCAKICSLYKMHSHWSPGEYCLCLSKDVPVAFSSWPFY